jgi:quercetin dioxygenase-like cupin family protein
LTGAEHPPHVHASSEQIRLAVSGRGTLLLAKGATHPICAGEVVQFAGGDLHGFKNTGSEPFVYLSVTSPPIDFSYVYAR